MAYDPVRNRIVLYGGFDGTDSVSSVFEWDGTWTPVQQSATSPGARQYATLVYDRGRSRMLLVGGETEAMGLHADVWSYAAGTWTLLPMGTMSPQEIAGTGTSVTFDPARGVLALRDNRGTNRDELWAWNDGWTPVCQDCTGRPRVAASLVHDPVLATTFLLNGFDAAMSAEIDGTWRLVGNQLVLITAEPGRRDSHGVAYDAARDVIVMYGGNGNACPPSPFHCKETWEMVPER